MKIYRIVYFLILLVLAVLCALLITAKARAGIGSARYVSPWTEIEPGETVAFQHQLGTRPLELFVWVMLAEKGSESDTGATIIPYYDLTSSRGTIKVVSVGTGYIYVQNLGNTEHKIKVVAKP